MSPRYPKLDRTPEFFRFGSPIIAICKFSISSSVVSRRAPVRTWTDEGTRSATRTASTARMMMTSIRLSPLAVSPAERPRSLCCAALIRLSPPAADLADHSPEGEQDREGNEQDHPGHDRNRRRPQQCGGPPDTVLDFPVVILRDLLQGRPEIAGGLPRGHHLDEDRKS